MGRGLGRGHLGPPRDAPGLGRMDTEHLLRICFLISLEGSSQFCKEETAGQGCPPPTERAAIGGSPILTFWLSESQKVRPK